MIGTMLWWNSYFGLAPVCSVSGERSFRSEKIYKSGSSLGTSESFLEVQMLWPPAQGGSHSWVYLYIGPMIDLMVIEFPLQGLAAISAACSWGFTIDTWSPISGLTLGYMVFLPFLIRLISRQIIPSELILCENKFFKFKRGNFFSCFSGWPLVQVIPLMGSKGLAQL